MDPCPQAWLATIYISKSAVQADFLQPQRSPQAGLDQRSQSERLAYPRSVRQSSDEDNTVLLQRAGSLSPSLRQAAYHRGGSLPTLLSRQVAHVHADLTYLLQP